jgi:hypothetical protein
MDPWNVYMYVKGLKEIGKIFLRLKIVMAGLYRFNRKGKFPEFLSFLYKVVQI